MQTRAEQKKTLEQMMKIYCRGVHKTKGELCESCQELSLYAFERLEKCPFGDEKPFCSNCSIHCYKPQMREKMSQAMRYSGKRMIFYSPQAAIKHLIAKFRK